MWVHYPTLEVWSDIETGLDLLCLDGGQRGGPSRETSRAHMDSSGEHLFQSKGEDIKFHL